MWWRRPPGVKVCLERDRKPRMWWRSPLGEQDRKNTVLGYARKPSVWWRSPPGVKHSDNSFFCGSPETLGCGGEALQGKGFQKFLCRGMPVISGCGAEPRLGARVKIRKTQDYDKIFLCGLREPFSLLLETHDNRKFLRGSWEVGAGGGNFD